MLSANIDAYFQSGVRSEEMWHSADCVTYLLVAYIVMLSHAFVKLIVQPKKAKCIRCNT